MSVNFRYPNITGATDREQLVQVKSFLHQLVEQLNVTLPSLGTGSAQTLNVQGQEGSTSYYELRSLITQEIQGLQSLLAELSKKLQDEYVSDAELIQALADALTDAKESGSFDGPKGDTGPAPNISFSLDEDGNLYYELEE